MEPWSIDLDICLGTDTLSTLALDLTVGFYPFLLMIFSYLTLELYDHNFRPLVIILKPFRAIFSIFQRNWTIKTSIIDSYATFFLLSNTKFQSIVFDLLIPTKVFQFASTGHSKYYNDTWRLFYDASVPYFGKSHLPYAILAIAIALLFILFPILLLNLYTFTWFQKLLNAVPIRWHILHTFVDTYQGCFKDGTEPGTRDCRWFSSIFFFARFFLFLTSGFTFGAMYLVTGSIVLILLVILFIVFQPYKACVRHYCTINIVFLLHLALVYISMLAVEITDIKKREMTWLFYTLSMTFGTIPLLYIVVLTIYWIITHRKFGLELVRRLKAQKRLASNPITY